MDLTKFTSKIKKLQNPQQLLFVYGGPSLNFWGNVSGTSYRVGSNNPILEVDERDVEQLLAMSKRGRFYFSMQNAEDEDFSDTIDHEDDFTIINGIGDSLHQKIHDSGVHMFEDLYNKGTEWISALPRVSEEKAVEIHKQLEVIIEEYRRM